MQLESHQSHHPETLPAAAPVESLGDRLRRHGRQTGLYTWAIGKDLVETSPCVGLSKPSPETQRDRVLTEDEVRAVWAGCDAEPGIIADAFRLMLVTAQRRGEALSMRWQDVDGSWWTII